MLYIQDSNYNSQIVARELYDNSFNSQHWVYTSYIQHSSYNSQSLIGNFMILVHITMVFNTCPSAKEVGFVEVMAIKYDT